MHNAREVFFYTVMVTGIEIYGHDVPLELNECTLSFKPVSTA